MTVMLYISGMEASEYMDRKNIIHCHSIPLPGEPLHFLYGTMCWCKPKICSETGVIYHSPKDLDSMEAMFKQIVGTT